MYLRLVGYLKENITILTTYRGQQKLIKELINKKCAWHEKFGRPHKVTVVDRY
jgi:intron-binding protein aquarius